MCVICEHRTIHPSLESQPADKIFHLSAHASAVESRQPRQQALPRAMQSPLNPQSGGNKDIRLARLNLLQRANIQIRQFRQTLLRDGTRHPFAPKIGAESV